ncbi:hypothetical protein GCM10010116_55760 [Microbispora rosea subsp. aerata]|nr:hypothetical protein [Microbispora rosea]GGO27814.1 hypothetical protein GCM10010116_55760 [Microbispora rosea subsp. aerata]GIH56958.1 hypothetical protein Mro02_38720 [Microbispora rosea subsp. aerata]GLJ82885.1 hypothetical protein GCM10017588_16110 [Microbispora rosea subsp. aerata]
MASGPHERDRRHPADDRDAPGARESRRPAAAPPTPPSTPSSLPPPELHHRPPAPSPWALPPFAAPVPDDAAPDGAAPGGAGDPDLSGGADESRGGPADPPAASDPWAPRPGPDEPRDHGPRTGRRPYAAPYGTPEPRHSRSGGRGREEPAAYGDAGATGPADAPATWHGEGARSRGDTAESTAQETPAAQEHPASEEGRPRRLVNRPDKLVASGPPRLRRAQIPRENPDGPDAPEFDPMQPDPVREHVWTHTPPEPAPRHDLRRPYEPADEDGEHGGIRMSPEIPVEPERRPEEEYAPPGPEDAPAQPVERIGRPPGGRPARPDVLVAVGPPRPGGGRRHRRTPPARRFPPRLPVRLPRPVPAAVVVVVLAVAAVLGVAVVRWAGGTSTAGVLLAAGDGQSGDAAFSAPGLPGNGSSQVLTAFAAAGATVVAAGSDTTSPITRPLFLVSADGGRHWQTGRVADAPGYESAPGAVGRVAGGDGRWLAVGTDAPGSAGPAARGMWVSYDGRSWTAVDPARLATFWSQDKITDVARTASGFLAVGATTLRDGTAGPVAWVSPDGVAWTRVDADQIGTPDKVRAMRAVAARGDHVVALADAGSGDSVAVVLRSDDGGRTWSRTAAALADVRPEPGALAATRKGFVLVPIRQKSNGGEVPVYCSPEGADWARCGTIGPLGAEGTGVRGLAASAAGVAAVAESAWERYAVYSSKDGRKWTKSADLGGIPGTLRGLAVTDAGVLVAGGDKRGPGDVENLPVLITAGKGKTARAVPLKEIAGLNRLARDTADVAAADGAFVAVGAANGDAAIWTSGNNGANWKDMAFPDLLGGPGRQALSGVAHGPKGWLAVGSTTTDPAATRPLLVTSADGKSWRPGPAVQVPAGHFLLAPSVVAAGPKGYVMVGEDRSATGTLPALWFSSDLKRFKRAEPDGMPAGGAGVRLHDVAATPHGFVAVGGAGTADRETGVVWVSSDGLEWNARGRVLPPDATSAGLRHVAATEDGVVVVGTAMTEDGPRPFSALSTDDGESWEYGTLPADAAASVLDVTVTGRGLVAVGSHRSSAEGAETDSAAWISANGVDWSRRTLTQDGLGGQGAQWLGAVAASGDRVVAIGRSAGSATGPLDDHLTIWRSTITER